MKALLHNVKGLKQREVIICNVNSYEVPTLRSMIESLNGNIHKGTQLNLSQWSDSQDYVVSKITSDKVVFKTKGMV